MNNQISHNKETALTAAPPNTYNLPPTWRVVRLSDVSQKSTLIDPHKEPNKTFIYVDVSSVSNESFRITETTELLGKDAPSRARRKIRTDDVIFATVRPTLKRIAMVPPELDAQVCSTGFCVIRAHREKLEPAYAYFYLLTEWIAKQVDSLQKGVAYPAINDSDLFSQIISLPPIDEQRAIAYALQTIQEAGEVRQRELTLERERKAALMQHLFNHGTRGEPRKQTEVGEIPESWDVMKLGDLIDIKHGYAFKSKYFIGFGDIVLTPGNFLIEGGLYWGEKTKFTSEVHPAEFLFDPGDLVAVMTDLTPSTKLLGAPAFIPEGKRILHNQRIGKILLKNNITSKGFLYWVFNSETFRKHMAITATGSTVRHTSPSRIKGLFAIIEASV
jgi:type I restriction enzyme S subunit